EMVAFQFGLPLGDVGLFHVPQVPFAHHIVAFARPVGRDIRTPETIVSQRLAETGIEIDRIVRLPVTIAPTATFGRAFHPSVYCVVVYLTDVLPYGCAAHAPGQIDL